MAKSQVMLELEQLRARLEEAEETLQAIRNGQVDALVVSGSHGEQVYTLRGADHSYRMLLQEMNEGAAMLLPDGTILYCNKRFAGMLDMPLEKVIGTSIDSFLAPTDRQAFETLVREGKQGRAKAEVTFALEEGILLPTYCSISPVQIDELCCLCLVATDLTEQKRNEEIVAAEKLARSILEQAADSIVVCDENGTIIQASRAAHELAGTNVLHQSFETVFPLTFKDGTSLSCSVADAEEAFSIAACLGGRAVRSVEVQFKRPEGKRFDLLMSAGPLRDSEQRVLGCVFTLSDITERKQAEEDLRRSEGRLATELAAMSQLHQLSTRLFNSRDLSTALDEILDAAIAMQGADFGNVQLYNPATRTLEIVVQRGFKQDFLEYFRSVGVDDDSTCARAMRERKRMIVEDVEADAGYARYRDIVTAAGYRAVQSTPLLSRGGDLLGILSTHFRQPYRLLDRDLRMLDLYAQQAGDLIDRIRAEEALRESEERSRLQANELEQQLIASGRLVSLGEITASMAHEFNNPLGIVIGFTQDLLSETDSSNSNYQSLKIIHEEAKRCEKIIRDLLQFARPSSADLRPSDVKQLIERTLSLVSIRLYKEKIEAVVQLDEKLPKIHADARQLEQVLVNLCLNAIDAMPDGGRLTVGAKWTSAASSSREVVLSIADTGFGIDGKDLSRIFQPFFTAKKKRGMGLGLTICERIIKNHGGRIEVESQPGRGTTFKVHLPVERILPEQSRQNSEREGAP
jgi:PAS domain S-box-containing protein